MEENAKGIQET